MHRDARICRFRAHLSIWKWDKDNVNGRSLPVLGWMVPRHTQTKIKQNKKPEKLIWTSSIRCFINDIDASTECGDCDVGPAEKRVIYGNTFCFRCHTVIIVVHVLLVGMTHHDIEAGNKTLSVCQKSNDGNQLKLMTSNVCIYGVRMPFGKLRFSSFILWSFTGENGQSVCICGQEMPQRGREDWTISMCLYIMWKWAICCCKRLTIRSWDFHSNDNHCIWWLVMLQLFQHFSVWHVCQSINTTCQLSIDNRKYNGELYIFTVSTFQPSPQYNSTTVVTHIEPHTQPHNHTFHTNEYNKHRNIEHSLCYG